MGVCLLAGFLFGTWRATWFNISINKETTNAISYSKTWLSQRIQSCLPEEEANLGLGYLLGEKDGLSDSFKDSLRIAGLSHIVVASGAHLSIIVSFVRKIFGKISRRTGLVFALFFVLVFMALVGWTPSILRAGIMSLLSLVMWYVGKKFEPWRLILITAAITLLINPSFISNLGWQLSFASYGGIMILGPSIMKFFYADKKPKFFGSIIITTLAATLMVAPISLYHFGSLSLISVAANIVILPTLSFAMGLTFLAGLLGPVPVAGMAICFITEKLLSFHIMVIEFFGAQEYFLISIPKNQAIVFLLYAPIVFFLFFKTKFLQRWTIRQKNAKISKI